MSLTGKSSLWWYLDLTIVCVHSGTNHEFGGMARASSPIARKVWKRCFRSDVFPDPSPPSMAMNMLDLLLAGCLLCLTGAGAVGELLEATGPWVPVDEQLVRVAAAKLREHVV